MASLTYDEAAHLLRRMGFGGKPDEVAGLVAKGREGAVDYLLNYDAINNDAEEEQIIKAFGKFIDNNFFQLERWWFTRMALTRRQFEEKMVLFWHNHFATASAKVLSPEMYNQNRTLRQYALDRFDTLLLNVAQDPAMLIWLDGITNIKDQPNENFARELQELFSMGIQDVVTGEPNYDESDVKEIARAFTGWRFKLKVKKNRYVFKLAEGLHDNGNKKVYGQTANFGGEDIITLICARRATGRFLVKRLFQFFVYPLTAGDEDKATIEKFADIYVTSNHSIKALVGAIFKSDEFFSERARFALVKNPIEFTIGAMRMLGVQYTGNDGTYARTKPMGLQLFNPPDVGGWKMGLNWINTATLLERYNFANELASTRTRATNVSLPFTVTTNDLFRKYTDPNPQRTVENFLSVLGSLKVGPEMIRILTDYLQTDDMGMRVAFVVDEPTIDKTVRGLVHLIMCLPQFQLN